MPLFFSIQIFPEEFIYALNWTLIHSMWQGMLLSLVAGVIVFFTKRKSPALRYNLITGSLLVFIIAVGSTLGFQIIKATHGADVPQTIAATQTIAIDPVTSSMDVDSKLSITAKAINFFNAYAGWIVLTWLLIMGLQCIRLTFGLYGVYRLKRIQVFDAGEYWNSRIHELSRQLQINKPVRLLHSGIAKVPLVIGYFSPVILFPASMFTSLQADEVEAILIHELAHIRRQDFLVNMLQNIIEIIFFFNPAVLWVSSLIKAERENCCDDIAVIQTGGKRNYINALMAFGELNLQPASSLTNAFASKNNHLINRVKRIIYNNNKTLSNMEKKFLAAGIILTGVFIFAFSSNIAQQKEKQKTTVIHSSDIAATDKKPADLTTITDTIPGADADRREISNETINTTINGKKYKMVTHNGQVDELYVNGKKIPADQMGSYKSVTEKIIVQSKIDREQSEKDMIESQKDMEESKREQAESMIESQKDMEESKREQLESEKDMAEAKLEMEREKKEMQQEMEQSKREMEQSKKEMQQDMEQSKKEMEQSQKEMQQNMEQSRKQMEATKLEMEKSKKDMAQAKLQMEQSKKDMALHREQAEREMEKSKKQMEQSKKQMEQSRQSMEQAKHEMEQSKKDQEEITGDFIKENIIKNKEGLSSYKLSNDELIVNGVKQPDAIHKKFKDKYVKGKDWSGTYNYNVN